MAKLSFWRSSAANAALAIGLMAAASPALADVDDAIAAYEAGDHQQAMELFRPLADAGDARAQYWVGRMFERGEGVPLSLARAAMWLRLAASQDSEEAQTALDTVLETLRAREAGQPGPQIADNGITPGQRAAGDPQVTTPEYEPERDAGVSAPNQVPDRDAGVQAPGAVPGRDGQSSADGAGSQGTLVADGDRSVVPDADSGSLSDPDRVADGLDAPTDDMAQGTEANDVGDEIVDDPTTYSAGDGDTDGYGVEDSQDDDLVADYDEATVEDGDIVSDTDAIEALAVDDAADQLADDLVDDLGPDADEGPVELAALDEDLDAVIEAPYDETAIDELDPDIAGDVDVQPELPNLPPELAAALADGQLEAEEIDQLVEDGVINPEMVDELVEAGLLDEDALAQLADAGVLDQEALDALVDNGLIDESLADEAVAALDADVLSNEGDDNTSMLDRIGDGVTQLFDAENAPGVEPARRLITARQ